MPDSINQQVATAGAIATLTESNKNVKESIDKLTGKVDTSLQQNADIQKSIAVLSSQQQGNVDYQAKCDKERRELDKKIDEKASDLEKKVDDDSKEQWVAINSNKNSITRLDTRAGIIGSLSGIGGTFLVEAAIKLIWH